MRRAVLFVAAAGVLAGCRAHTQELALDQAAQEFFAEKPPLCGTQTVKAHETSSVPGSTPSSDGVPGPMISETRAQLSPWIVGPNEYVIEGCEHQARYRCDSESCRREGNIDPLRAFVELAAPPPGAVQPATATTGEAAPPLVDNDAEADAVRAALDARRGEIATCVEAMPVGVQVELKVGAPPTVSLRGSLKGKPEEGCVRSALKDLKVPPVKAPSSVIHLVK